MLDAWDMIWGFITEHYIFHTILFISMAILLFSGKRFLKFHIGKDGISIEKEGKSIDPKIPCPYNQPHPNATAALDKNTEIIKILISNIHELTNKTDKSQEDINEIYINGLKKSYWNKTQPLAERLKDGLEYVVIYKRNGTTKEAVLKTAQEHPQVYEGIIAGKQELKLESFI